MGSIFDSKKKTTTNQTQTQNQSGSTRPVLPANLQSGLDDFISRIGQFAAQDPSSLAAGASPLQQQAFAAAQNLGGWQGTDALRIANDVAGRGANTSGGAPMVSGTSYQPGSLGAAGGYQAASSGAVPQVQAYGYDPAQLGRTVIGPIQQAQATDARAYDAQAQSLLKNLKSYMSPYTDDVVSTTLAGFDDQAGRVRAQQAAEAARNKAFGGSRYAIREAQTEADLARERAGTEAGLRDRAFNVGAGLSADDANRRQQASIFNAGQRTAVDVGNADRRTGVSTFNAGQDLQRALSQAGFDFNTGAFNADSRNSAAQMLAQQLFGASGANADLASRHALDFAGRQDAASQFGLGQQQQRDLASFDATTGANRFAAEAGLQAQLANQAAAMRSGEFNATQRDAADTRALQAAQLLGGLASDRSADQRANLATIAGLGEQQRGIDQQGRLSQLAQLQAVAQLFGLPVEALRGQDVTGSATGTLKGTTVEKSTPSLFDSFLSLASLFGGPGGGK